MRSPLQWRGRTARREGVTLTWLVSRSFGTRLAAGLAAPWLFGALLISQLMAMIDPVRTGELAGALPPLGSAALWSGLALLCALSSAGAVVTAHRAPGMAWLRAQPVPRWRWALAWLGPIATLGSPVAAAAWFVHPLATVALGAPAGALALALARPGRRLPGVLASTGLLATVSAVGVGLGWLPALLFASLTVPLAGGLHPGPDGDSGHRTWSLLPAVPQPLVTLLLRDLRALLRLRPWWVLAGLLVSAPAAATQHALTVNGHLRGDALDTAAVLLVVIVGLGAGSMLTTLAEALGPALDPPGDPISARMRGTAWWLLGLAWIAPTVLGLSAIGLGTPLGPVRTSLAALAVTAGAGWLCLRLAPERRAHAAGPVLWWVIGLGIATGLGPLPSLGVHALALTLALTRTGPALTRWRNA